MIQLRLILVFTLASSLGLAACASKSEPPLPPPDGTPDAGPVDSGPPPARTLVTQRGLFGDTGIENGFINPDLDLLSDGWFAFPLSPRATERPLLLRQFLTATPTRQPTLLVRQAPSNANGAALSGTARATPGPFVVSVWIGRTPEQEAEMAAVSLTGVNQDGELAYDLEPDASTRQQLGEIVWVRHSATVTDGPVGFVQLVANPGGAAQFWLTGAVLDRGPNLALRGNGERLGARSRALSSLERRAREVMAEHLANHIGDVRPRPRSPLVAPPRRPR